MLTICYCNNMQVGILKRVLEEVEKVMQEFMGMLYKSMEDPHLDLAEVSRMCL
jgi:exocyst complex component 2